MTIVRLSSKGQILVPKHLREKFGLNPGSKVRLTEEAGRLVLTPVTNDPIAAATGFLQGAFSLTADLCREHRKQLRRMR
jgi:AbrB family looped-hinge helix DNA binding protein